MKTKKILAATLLLCTATLALAQEEKPKTAIIKKASWETTMYVDFVGDKFATEALAPDISNPFLGIQGYYHLRIISDSAATVVINMDAKTGIQSPAYTLKDHLDSMLNQGLYKVGEEEVYGKICDKYAWDSLQFKKYLTQRLRENGSSEEVLAQKRGFPQIFKDHTVWMWNGVILQSKFNGRFLVTPDDILEIQVNVPLPAEKFAIPEGTTIQAAAAKLQKF
jgi:hypothetical protein